MPYKRYQNKIVDLFKTTKGNSFLPRLAKIIQKRIFLIKKDFSNYVKDLNFGTFFHFSDNSRRNLQIISRAEG